MTSIATLGIEVKTSGVQSAERDLQGLTKQGAAAERQADKLSASWVKSGKVIGGAIASGIGFATTAFGLYIKNTIEAEKVQAQLAARIKSTGAAAGLAIGDLNKMADKFQAATTVDDEAIGRSQALLLTFTKVTKENFERATKAALDMSTALDTDLQSATLQVGKALNDPVRGLTALSRAGVQFSQSQRDVIKGLVETGRTADAQKIILSELERQMGGSAEAARNTLGGALSALRNSFDDLLKGKSGDAGIVGARNAIESLNRTMNDPRVKSGVQTIINGMASIANAALAAIPKLVAFNNTLSVSFGLTGSGGKRKGNILDFGGGIASALNSLVHGDINGFRAGAARGRAGFNGSNVTDFTNVKGAVDGNRADFSNVIGRSGGVGGPAFNPDDFNVGGGGGGSRGGGGGRSLPDFAKDSADELKRLAEQEAGATESFLDMQAALAGPLAQEMREHDKRVAELNDLAKQSPAALAGLNDALALEAKRHDDATKAIQAQLDPIGTLLDDMKFELDVIGRSNAERAVMNELRRQGIDVMSQEAQGALATARAFEAEADAKQRSIGLMDEFRRGASDALTDFVTGAKSAKEAFTDFFDSIAKAITQAIADQWIQKLFGAQGTTGQGTSGGGFLSSILGALFSSGGSGGGGFASGGYTGDGPENQIAGVVHKGEYVIPARDVRQMRQGGMPGMRGDVTVNQAIYVQGSVDQRTRNQLRVDTGREQRRAMARDGR